MARFCFVRLLAVLSLSSALLFSGCGGGSSTTTSSSGGGGTTGGGGGTVSNPVPGIASVAPASVVAGTSAQTLTLTGTNFISASTVNLNGAALTTTYVSATSVQAALPAAAIAADGSAKITVANPAPGGGTSQALTYVITVPTPVIASLSPQIVPQGVAATITISGSGFEANSVAQWNSVARTTTFVNSTTLQVALTAADLQAFGTGQIAVANPGLAATTPLDLQILSTTPAITGVSPNSFPVNTASNVPQQIYITGSGFAANATVQANGQPLAVSSQTSTSVLASLAASYFAGAGSISIVVSNPGSPVVSSNAFTLTVSGPTAPAFTVSPNSAPAGSPDTVITLNGGAFYSDSVVSWNNSPLATTYVSPYNVTAVIPAALLEGFVQASISVATPETAAQGVAPAQPFDTYLALAVNDIVYNSVDGFIYASIPGSAGGSLGNTIAAVDPASGVIEKTIPVGSEPNRLALSSDGTQIFVGLNGAGAVRQVNLTTGTAGVQVSLGGGPGVYNPPYTAVSLAAVPGEPNSVAVYATNGIVTIFDSGVARANSSSGLQTYFTQNVGALAFGSSASTLYVTSNAISGYLYQLTVDATGITAATQLATSTTGNTLQYDNGRLYVPNGVALDATTGDQLGQFSITNSNSGSSTIAAAIGPIVSDSTLNRAWIVPSNLPYNSSTAGELVSFDETTFNPVSSLAITGVNPTGVGISASDLIRWGQNGLAFHTAGQLYVIQGEIVKDLSSSPADVGVTVQAPATGTTGTSLNYTVTVQNAGPNAAQGVTLTATLPGTAIAGSVTSGQGSCAGTGVLYCDLGAIASGSSVTISIPVTPTVSGTLTLTASVASVSYDPVESNDQASASTAATGSLFSAAPVVTQLSPTLIQAGSNSFTLTVDGEGFTPGSTVTWNGAPLPTTLLSGGQLTATVESSLVTVLGWSQVAVTTSAPGGGQSAAIPFSIYQLLNVPANAMAYDPFTQNLYAVLPSTSPTIAGNSVVAINPATASVGSPIQVGSEPNLLSETSDGNYFFIGLSGAKSVGRFNLLSQSLDLTVSLPTVSSYPYTAGAASSLATVPGSDASLAIATGYATGIGIFDISGSTGTFRPNFSGIYDGTNPVFSDATHFYAYDNETTGAEFYRYSINGSGVTLIDGTTLDGLGGFSGGLVLDGGLVYGSDGGIINPSTTPPSQVAVLPIGSGYNGDAVVAYTAESKSFDVAANNGGNNSSFLQRFDTGRFTLDQQIQLPAGSTSSVAGTRWGQDGLAFVVSLTGTGNTVAPEIFLIRGPFVLPAEAVSNAAPALSTTDHNTITAGSGNVYVTVTGSGFLPGATILWNGAARTTNFVDSAHLTVAIPASDVLAASTATISGANPGSSASNTLSVTVQ